MRTMLIVVLAVLPMVATAQQKGDSGKRIQCWTDSRGLRTCGDQVPPQEAKQERQYYNSQGVVVDTRERQKTPEEVADDERKAAEAAALKKQAQEQAAYDRFLVDTYSSVKDLQTALKLRLQMIDGRMGLAQKAINDNQKTLDDLHGRVAQIQKNGKQPDARLLNQIKKYEDAMVENKDALTKLQEERVHIDAKFKQDIERYRQLRPGS